MVTLIKFTKNGKEKIIKMEMKDRMRVYEVKEHIQNTNVNRDIFDMSRMLQRLTFYTEFVQELNQDDSNYISILSSKAKKLICIIYNIFDVYMKEILENGEIQKSN